MKTREEIVARINELLVDNKNCIYRAWIDTYVNALLWTIGEETYCQTCLRVDCKCSPD